MDIPPDISNLILAVTAVAAGILGTLLARKGKREDTKIANINAAHIQLSTLAEERRLENQDLRTQILTERAAHREEINAERAAHQATRDREEARWSRQMTRCRSMTDSLVKAMIALRETGNPMYYDNAKRDLEQHNFEDHNLEEA